MVKLILPAWLVPFCGLTYPPSVNIGNISSRRFILTIILPSLST